MGMVTGQVFTAALRELGVVRLRLDQIITAYHNAFPHDVGHPDMRQRLHRAIAELVEAGTVMVPHGDGPTDNDPFGLPQALELRD